MVLGSAWWSAQVGRVRGVVELLQAVSSPVYPLLVGSPAGT